MYGIRTFKTLLPVLTLGWLLSACATPMPASEGLVFTERYKHQKDNSPSPVFPGRNGYLKSLSDHVSLVEMHVAVSRLIPPRSMERAALNKYGSQGATQLNPNYLYSIPLPALAVAWRDRFALGGTIPVPLLTAGHIDGTLRIVDQYYVTVNRKFFGGTEVILQRRLLYKLKGGLSLGAFYRYDPLHLTDEGGLYSGGAFSISWFGLRSVVQTPFPEFRAGIHLRGNFSGGYVPEFKTPLISFGISVVLGARDRQR